jgi:hypothetical protein
MYKKLIIGIDENTDIKQLLEIGIRQFYFGYIPKEYAEKYSTQVSLNRRYRLKEQFVSLEKSFNVIEQIHQYNGIIHLALNSFTKNNLMLDYTKKVYEQFVDKVDGIIVANIATANMLKKKNYKNIVISNLFGVYSKQSVDFLQKYFNPVKIILPRDITLKTIEEIVTAYPNQKFECFLFGDNCRYSESFCFTEHGYDSIGFNSLCSFALKEKIPIKSATPIFKHIVKNSKLTNNEKKAKLQKKFIDIQTLLDNCQIAIYEHNPTILAQSLDILDYYDVEMFKKSKALYIRTLDIMKNIDNSKAKKIEKKLKNSPFKAQNEYFMFHKLNNYAIKQTIKFFNKFDNIVSYKIPARGRDFYRYIFSNDKKEYNYKESQYRL